MGHVVYPLPNSLFGQGLGDRLGADQNLQTQIYRAVLNNLHYSIDPVKVVNPELTNLDDVLNLHPGKIIRSEDVNGGISYTNPPFVASAAIPILDLIDQRNEMSTGVGKTMVSIDASDLQDVI
ncbi:portal protein [Agrobacterium tumefaciens]|uniref:portal protein n=1 Tax=Agrobacterium tumefaciens TaxID=358 RepID=UPI003AF4522E